MLRVMRRRAATAARHSRRVSGGVVSGLRNAKCPVSHLRNAKCPVSHLRNAKCPVSNLRNMRNVKCPVSHLRNVRFRLSRRLSISHAPHMRASARARAPHMRASAHMRAHLHMHSAKAACQYCIYIVYRYTVLRVRNGWGRCETMYAGDAGATPRTV